MSSLDKSAKEKLQTFSRIHSELTMLEERVKETKNCMDMMGRELRDLVDARECEKLGLTISGEEASSIRKTVLARVCGIKESAIEYKKLMSCAIADACSYSWFNGLTYGNDTADLCWVLQNKQLLRCGDIASLGDVEFEELSAFYADVRETVIKLMRPHMSDSRVMEAFR